MRLAFSSLGCPDWDLDTIARQAKQEAMGGVELRGAGREHISPEFSTPERRYVKDLFADHGVEIACISAYTRFSVSDAQERARNETELLQFAELADDVDCKYVRTFFGSFPEGVTSEQVYDYVAESLNRVGRKLAGSNVMALVESHDSMSSAAMLKPLLDRITESPLGVLWDMAHTFREGEELARSYEILGPHIKHIHVKDEYHENGKIVHCIPGEGIMPITACRDLMLSKGYAGYFSLEWEKKWHPTMPPLAEALPAFRTLMMGS